MRRSITIPKRDLNRKAYALLRIAATFNSPRYQKDDHRLYQLLRNTRTVETDGIRLISKIFEDNRWVEVDELIENQKISEDDEGLIVFIALDEEAQDFCFCSALAPDFAAWVMCDPLTNIGERVESDMITALGTVIAAELYAVGCILDHQGINQISIPYEEVTRFTEVAIEQSSHLDSVSIKLAQAPISPHRLPSDRPRTSEEQLPTPNRGHLTSSAARSSEQRRVLWSETTRRSPDATLARYTTVASNDASFCRLLNRAIQSARAATFPAKDAFDTSNLLRTLPNSNDYGQYTAGSALRSLNRLERDRKVGTVGELFVFELLSRLEFPLSDWCGNNWQSTIRHLVGVHPDYEDLEQWSGRETADFTYNDINCALTTLLIDRGYLDHEKWQAERTKYYIEVKATTGSLDTPLFVSKNQCKRMRDIHNAGDRAEVYILLRVCEIESAGIAMEVHLDPEQMRLDETLRFTADTWSVVPC